MDSRFDGSAVLVIGGAHGIGRACAVRLAGEGARVAVLDRDLDAARTVAAGLPGPADTHPALPVDVTDTSSVDAAVAAAVKSLGGLDALVHVAGGASAHLPFEQSTDAEWHQEIELNLLGVVRSTRAALPHLRRSTRTPAVVVISSINALAALGEEAYSAAKAGLGGLVLNLAGHGAPDGVRVNLVAPGTVRTRVWDGQEGGADRLADWYPLGRVGEPEDIAAAVAFLASSDASWITGHTLPVDGGFLMNSRISG